MFNYQRSRVTFFSTTRARVFNETHLIFHKLLFSGISEAWTGTYKAIRVIYLKTSIRVDNQNSIDSLSYLTQNLNMGRQTESTELTKLFNPLPPSKMMIKTQ